MIPQIDLKRQHEALRGELMDAAARVLVGAGEVYEARCRRCWTPDPAKARPATMEEAGALGA
jgi:thymidine kinase